jgi:hypothetical protein
MAAKKSRSVILKTHTAAKHERLKRDQAITLLTSRALAIEEGNARVMNAMYDELVKIRKLLERKPRGRAIR